MKYFESPRKISNKWNEHLLETKRNDYWNWKLVKGKHQLSGAWFILYYRGKYKEQTWSWFTVIMNAALQIATMFFTFLSHTTYTEWPKPGASPFLKAFARIFRFGKKIASWMVFCCLLWWYKVRSKINETFVIKIFWVAPSVNEVVRWKVICLTDFQW